MKIFLAILLALLCWASAPQAQTSRVIYLATVQGDGTDANPFRATGYGTTPNQSCIDFRADPTVSTGRMLCAADSLPAGGGINQLASTFGDTVTAPRKAAIEAALGVTLTASNIIDVIAELLTTHARLDGTRWRPLQAGRDGKYKIWLGTSAPAWQQTAWLWDEWQIRDHGLVADVVNTLEPTIAWAVTLSTETFTGTDGDLDGRTFVYAWTENQGICWSIVSNQASCSANSQNEAWMNASLDTVNHSVTLTLVSLEANASLTRCGPIARKANSSTRTYYFWYADANTGGAEYSLAKRVAGTFTQLTNNTQDPVNGDVLKLPVDGSSLSGYVNGVLLAGPTTDTSIAGNTYLGLAFNSASGSARTCTVDNLIGADITADGAARRRHS